MTKAVTFVILLILAVGGNAISYWLKTDLKTKGYKTYGYWGHFNDLINARRIISKTNDLQIKRTYTLALSSLIIILIAFILIFILSFIL